MGFKARQRTAQRPASIDELVSGKDKRLVSFKPSAAVLEEEDLVALANTADGGSIVLGIESKKRGRKAVLTVTGCALSVAVRKAITGKAEACIPPVAVAVSEAVHGGKKVVRIDVEASAARPHCSSRGAYVVRDGGATVPLTREQLAALLGSAATGSGDVVAFMRESFAATQALMRTIGEQVAQEISDLTGSVGVNTEAIKRSQDRVFGELIKRLDDNGKRLEDNARRLDQNGKRLDYNGRRLDYNGKRLAHNSKLLTHNGKLLEENRKFIRLVAGHTGLKLQLEPVRPPLMLVQLRRDEDGDEDAGDNGAPE